MRQATAHKADEAPTEVWWVGETAYGLVPIRGRLYIREAAAKSHHSLRTNQGWATNIRHGRIVWDDETDTTSAIL